MSTTMCCQCELAKKIWRLLEITHEGTNQVKKSKIDILVHSYKLFSIKDNKFIFEMFTRLTDIISGLQALEKFYKESKKIKNILGSLAKQ